MKQDIHTVTVSLSIDETTSLFVLLSADGSINRMGNGTLSSSDNDMFIGVTREPLFRTFLQSIPEGFFEFQGEYDIPDKKGAACELTILCADQGRKMIGGYRFLYGAESDGPPGEICSLVQAAVDLTDPWHEEQKTMVANAKTKK